MKVTEASETPSDRLTRMCDAMTKQFDFHPEHKQGDKCIVFLEDGDVGGLVIHGYEDMAEAIGDLFVHLRAMFRARGGDLDLIGIPEDLSELDDG